MAPQERCRAYAHAYAHCRNISISTSACQPPRRSGILPRVRLWRRALAAMSCTGCVALAVVGPDAGAVQKRHPELDPARLGQTQQPLPHAQVGPANKGLSRPRPGTQVSGDGPPLGSILMPPEDGRDCAPQILRWGLAL